MRVDFEGNIGLYRSWTPSLKYKLLFQWLWFNRTYAKNI